MKVLNSFELTEGLNEIYFLSLLGQDETFSAKIKQSLVDAKVHDSFNRKH
jgi:hypothetical protein